MTNSKRMAHYSLLIGMAQMRELLEYMKEHELYEDLWHLISADRKNRLKVIWNYIYKYRIDEVVYADLLSPEWKRKERKWFLIEMDEDR